MVTGKYEVAEPQLLTSEQFDVLAKAAERFYGRPPTADEFFRLLEWCESALFSESVVHMVLDGRLDAGWEEDAVVVRMTNLEEGTDDEEWKTNASGAEESTTTTRSPS